MKRSTLTKILTFLLMTGFCFGNSLPKQSDFYQFSKGGEMGGTQNINIKERSLISGGLFIPTFITGFTLSSGNVPHNIWLTTTHKLTGVANCALLNYTVFQKNKAQKLTGEEIASTVAMNLCYLTTIVTGALLTSENPQPEWIHTVHSIAPWLSVLSSAILIYFLNK